MTGDVIQTAHRFNEAGAHTPDNTWRRDEPVAKMKPLQ